MVSWRQNDENGTRIRENGARMRGDGTKILKRKIDAAIQFKYL
jgi:hypothetical protein